MIAAAIVVVVVVVMVVAVLWSAANEILKLGEDE